MHGGKIWLSSRELEGSVFSFTMEMPPEDVLIKNEMFEAKKSPKSSALLGIDSGINGR